MIVADFEYILSICWSKILGSHHQPQSDCHRFNLDLTYITDNVIGTFVVYVLFLVFFFLQIFQASVQSSLFVILQKKKQKTLLSRIIVLFTFISTLLIILIAVLAMGFPASGIEVHFSPPITGNSFPYCNQKIFRNNIDNVFQMLEKCACEHFAAAMGSLVHAPLQVPQGSVPDHQSQRAELESPQGQQSGLVFNLCTQLCGASLALLWGGQVYYE
jgi:hypothetical protein